MVERLIYAIKQAIVYRKTIRQIKTSDLSLSTITQISDHLLQQHKIKALVLDFDGVMSAHGGRYPYDEVAQWLRQRITNNPEIQWFILSNNPWQVRQEYFAQHFPEVQFVGNVKKKPYPDGMLAVCELAACQPESAAIVDDRLLTGCLASAIAGCQSVYISKAYTDIKTHPVKECFFMLLRAFEKVVF